MTSPQNILPLVKFVSTGLKLGLLTKDEVIDWADKIVTEEGTPDIFFIDLLLMNSKDVKFILSYIERLVAFKEIPNPGRPLLGQLHKNFAAGKFGLEKSVRTLFGLKFTSIFTPAEEWWIYKLDDIHDLARNANDGATEEVQSSLTAFLSIYAGYSLHNYEEWAALDKTVDAKLALLGSQYQ